MGRVDREVNDVAAHQAFLVTRGQVFGAGGSDDVIENRVAGGSWVKRHAGVYQTDSRPSERTVNYAFLLGGLTAAIFGIILLIRREEAIELLVILLGLWWLIQGAFMLFSVFIDREDMGWKIFLGLLGLIAGVVVLANPINSATFLGSALAITLGVIGLIIGVSAIFGYFRGGGFGALVFGVVSGLIGLLFISNPSSSASLMVTLFAALLLIDGVASIFLAIKYK